MGNRIKLPNTDFAKAIDNIIGRSAKYVPKFVMNHKEKFIRVGFLLVTIDDIHERLGRKKEQKAYKENSVKQQEVSRKHEAEINALRADAEQAHEAIRRVDQLDQIVKNITEGGGSE